MAPNWILRARDRFTESTFQDVDQRLATKGSDSRELRRIRAELRELKDKQGEGQIDQDAIEKVLSDALDRQRPAREVSFDSFMSYFESVTQLMEEKAELADNKASVLLDKGTFYAGFGILFFLCSIGAWQVMAWTKGEWQEAFFYGVFSCSILFVFIEFLSAWVLRQYRHFVDTSTYLIKVKSIFDRYMLAFLCYDGKSEEDKKDRRKEMATLLRADIKWPDTYMFKSGEASFAREAMESYTELAKSMRATLGSDGKKEENR